MRRWWGVARGRWFAIGLAGIGVLLLTSALAGERGLVRIALLRRELREASAHNFQLLQSIDRMRKRLEAIRTDDGALERLARRRLRLVRDGDTIYQLEPEASTPASRRGERPPER